MAGAFLTKLRFFSRGGARPDRVSFFLPFLIISLALGALAWRSYTLSVKMERGVSQLAGQYAGHSAEATARSVDAAVAVEMARVSEEWQQMEKGIRQPTFNTLRDWVALRDWILSAVYIPDYDPASTIFASEVTPPSRTITPVNREFYTSAGTLKYRYDPKRLLDSVQSAVRPQPFVRTREAFAIQRQADVELVPVPKGAVAGLQKIPGGVSYTSKLAAPLDIYGIRAVVRTEYVGGSGWQNQRTMSLWMSLVALILTGIGGVLAFRGINKETETMKLRGALIANVSHELRTPLSMIRLGAETLKRAKLKDHERQAIEDQILHEVLLLSHLVENVLDVARIQNRSTKALAFTPVGPRDLIRTLVTTYESWIRSKGFTVSMQLDETVEDQMWDRDAVSRALLNLIDNAIKYSGLDDERAISVILRQTAEHIVIEVKDRGAGIDAKDLTKIFDPYYRAKFSDTTTRRGAGLGLTLVQQILESHGGRVEVDSVPGTGSTFRLMFPRGLTGAPAEVPSLRAREAF